MADCYHLRIDLTKLAANIARAGREPFTEQDARTFLQENGFTEIDTAIWRCEEVSLGLLDQAEILWMEPIR